MIVENFTNNIFFDMEPVFQSLDDNPLICVDVNPFL